MYIARIVAITDVANVTSELLPFVEFKAQLDNIELKGSEKVIIFQIEGTGSYLSIFPNKIKSISDIEEELNNQGAILNRETKNKIVKFIEHKE